MSFRKPYVIFRESAGGYADGAWSPGTRSVVTVQATMQPVKMGQDMDSLPEGRTLSNTRKLYTTASLQYTEQGDGIQPDIIVHGGWGYEVTSAEESDSGIISHNKYIAYRAFPVTTAADWLSGATIRP